MISQGCRRGLICIFLAELVARCTCSLLYIEGRGSSLPPKGVTIYSKAETGRGRGSGARARARGDTEGGGATRCGGRRAAGAGGRAAV